MAAERQRPSVLYQYIYVYPGMHACVVLKSTLSFFYSVVYYVLVGTSTLFYMELHARNLNENKKMAVYRVNCV